MSENVRIKEFTSLKTPKYMKELYKLSDDDKKSIDNNRNIIRNIINNRDNRFLVIIGPCSIHEIKSAEHYASIFKKWKEKFSLTLFLVMRVYFEKPRTTTGWKGYINDPDLNGKFNINKGLEEARKFMVKLVKDDIPIACEFLDVFTPQYLGDLVSWGCIGARTTESQVHRELASGLSMPIGFKNPTTGFPEIAIESLISTASPHVFLGIDDEGKISFIRTIGNKDTHVVLRGSRFGINYDIDSISSLIVNLRRHSQLERIMIDCSHDNCRKNYKLQEDVVNSIIKYKNLGNRTIFGLMLESNIKEGKQNFKVSSEFLEYGKSITDGCICVDKSFELLNKLSKVSKL